MYAVLIIAIWTAVIFVLSRMTDSQSLSTRTNLSNDRSLPGSDPLLGNGKWCVHYVEILNKNITARLWVVLIASLEIFIIINKPIILPTYSYVYAVMSVHGESHTDHLLEHGLDCSQILLRFFCCSPQLLWTMQQRQQRRKEKNSNSLSVCHRQTILHCNALPIQNARKGDSLVVVKSEAQIQAERARQHMWLARHAGWLFHRRRAEWTD